MKRLLAVLLICSSCVSPADTATSRPAPTVQRIVVVKPPLVPVGLIEWSGTVPTMNNAGTCDAPVLVAGYDSVTIRYEWNGGEGSVGPLARGSAFAFTTADSVRWLRVWAEHGGAASCDTTIGGVR